MRVLFHIPKWLIEERFDLEYQPASEGSSPASRFFIRIFDVLRRECFEAYGGSISDAAKKALKAREDAG